MSRIKAGINIAKAGKTKISELVKKIKRRKYAKKHRKTLERVGRSAKSVSRYNIRAADQNVTVIPTKGQSQKGSSFKTHKLRGTGPRSRVGFESGASWRDEMDRMFGEIPLETFFKKKSKGGINIVMNKKFPNRGMGLQDEKIQPGKVIKARMGKATDYQNYLKGLKEATKKKSFIERRKELGGRALRAAKATKYGKIAAGVAGVGLAAKAYLNKKLEEAKAKRKKKELEGDVKGSISPYVKKKMGGGMIKRYNTGGDAESAEKRDIRKTEQMIGASISSKREQGRKDASYSRPKEVDNIIKAGQRDAGKRIKPKKAALGLMLMSKKGKENKKAMPVGMGLTAAKADAIKKILGMRTGKMVKARGCKLGRNKSTKII